MDMRAHSIRLATEADLTAIRAWLAQEHEDGVEGCFWSNLNVIEDGQKRGALTVLAMQPDDKPIAFCLSSAISLDILEVRVDFRNMGYGRALADHMIAEARASGIKGLFGQCMPEESLDFWRYLGFERVDVRREGIWVALAFRRRRELPDASYSIRIELAAEWPEVEIVSGFETRASLRNGSYDLEEEYVEYVDNPDTTITIWIDGQRFFSDRVKYGGEFGIEREDGWVRVSALAASPGD